MEAGQSWQSTAAVFYDEIMPCVELAEELNRAAEQQRKVMPILLQLNLSGEPTKFGTSEEEIFRMAERISRMPALAPAGLMTLPGIGRYTAGAIAAIAMNLPAPIVEYFVQMVDHSGNVSFGTFRGSGGIFTTATTPFGVSVMDASDLPVDWAAVEAEIRPPDVPDEVTAAAEVQLAAGAPFVSQAQLEESLAAAGVDPEVSQELLACFNRPGTRGR